MRRETRRYQGNRREDDAGTGVEDEAVEPAGGTSAVALIVAARAATNAATSGRTVRPRRSRFNSLAHIIGVKVSDTASYTSTSADKVIANSRNKRPTTSPISRIGMNTAISDRLMDKTVNPTSRAPLSAARMGDLPASI